MKRIIKYLFVSTCFFICQKTIAQLYVSPNSYVYVADNYVYVKQDVNLQNNGNVYLRNESQLLQGTAGNSTNQGAGKLSVFQEGTVNNYAYNYWCSPVGDSVLSGNGIFGASMLYRPTGLISSSPATLLPTDLEGTTSNTDLSIASRWIFKFLSSDTYSQWISVGSASSINAGEGFTMKGTSGTDTSFSDHGINNNPGSAQRYDFRGKPNDGNIDINVNTGKLTLTGNPYPSAINLNMFLLDNAAAGKISGVAYFWEQDPAINSHNLIDYRGGYGTYAPIDAFSEGVYAAATWNSYNPDGTINIIPPGPGAGGTYKRMICPIGQGFMVDGTTLGAALMKNSYRVFKKEGVANNSEFHRMNSANEFWGNTPNVAGIDYTKYKKSSLPQIKIHTIMNNQITKEMVLAFTNESTDGYDICKDAKQVFDTLPNNTYFPIDIKGEYVISTLPFDVEKRIPIALKCNSQISFKITVGSLINFDLADNIYVYDKLTKTYYDIKNGFCEVSLQSTTTDRFEITFKNPALSNVDLAILKGISAYQNNNINQLVISNPQLLNLKSYLIYDISGKVVLGKEQLGNDIQYVISTSSLTDGVYVVKLKTDNNLEINKKIIVLKK